MKDGNKKRTNDLAKGPGAFPAIMDVLMVTSIILFVLAGIYTSTVDTPPERLPDEDTRNDDPLITGWQIVAMVAILGTVTVTAIAAVYGRRQRISAKISQNSEGKVQVETELESQKEPQDITPEEG